MKRTSAALLAELVKMNDENLSIVEVHVGTRTFCELLMEKYDEFGTRILQEASKHYMNIFDTVVQRNRATPDDVVVIFTSRNGVTEDWPIQITK